MHQDHAAPLVDFGNYCFHQWEFNFNSLNSLKFSQVLLEQKLHLEAATTARLHCKQSIKNAKERSGTECHVSFDMAQQVFLNIKNIK